MKRKIKDVIEIIIFSILPIGFLLLWNDLHGNGPDELLKEDDPWILKTFILIIATFFCCIPGIFLFTISWMVHKQEKRQ